MVTTIIHVQLKGKIIQCATIQIINGLGVLVREYTQPDAAVKKYTIFLTNFFKFQWTLLFCLCLQVNQFTQMLPVRMVAPWFGLPDIVRNHGLDEFLSLFWEKFPQFLRISSSSFFDHAHKPIYCSNLSGWQFCIIRLWNSSRQMYRHSANMFYIVCVLILNKNQYFNLLRIKLIQSN